jgi:hypothetical protein
MADRPGCLIGIRVNSGPVSIKVTRYEFDTEIKENRTVTSDANCFPRTVIASSGGILRFTGFIDPTNAGSALLLAGASDLTLVKLLLDVSETAGSRHGYDLGNCKLIPRRITGNTDDAGMQEIEGEIHTQAGASYSSSLT